MTRKQPHSKDRAAAHNVAHGATRPIQTIGDIVIKEVRDLKELLSPMRDSEGPGSYLGLLASLDVLAYLSHEQQLKLSALVVEFYAQGDTVKWLKPLKKARRAWATDGPQRMRKLKGKVAAARRAIEAVISYLAKIGVSPGRSVDGALHQALAVLDPASLHKAAAVVFSLRMVEQTEDATLALYDFFTVECGLQKNEAEVRVGKIGNDLWDWNVAITERYSGGENWKGCAAVRKAVGRRRRGTDTRRTTD